MANDICVIGSGITGCIMAVEFARKGFSVTILEAGQKMGFPNPQRDAFVSNGETDYPLNLRRSRRIGGSSHCWAGLSPRFHPTDFRMRTLYGTADDWPISYEELEPFYLRAERALGVYGQDKGSLAPPRSAGYPMPPPFYPDLLRVQGVYRRAGIETCALAKALTSRPYEGRRAGTLYRADKVHLQQALKTGRVKLISNAVVRRLETDKKSRVKRAVYQGIGTPEKTAEASLFILACGGVENVRVLRLSSSEKFPDGLANGSGFVGAYFMDHPSVIFGYRMNRRVSFAEYALHSFQWYDHGRRPDRAAMLMEAHGYPGIKSVVRSSGLWGDVLKRRIRKEVGLSLTLAMMAEQLPDRKNFVGLDSAKKDLFGDPVPLIHYGYASGGAGAVLEEAVRILKGVVGALGGGAQVSFTKNVSGTAHHTGTCRMGKNADTSVVNPFQQSHEVPNLYVVGTSSFVTGGAANPTLTAVALALRTADQIVRLRGRAARPLQKELAGVF